MACFSFLAAIQAMTVIVKVLMIPLVMISDPATMWQQNRPTAIVLSQDPLLHTCTPFPPPLGSMKVAGAGWGHQESLSWTIGELIGIKLV